MKRSIGLACALFAFGLMAPAFAQTSVYVDTSCGSWQGDTWVPNGTCTTVTYKHERLAGTITAVKGHLVTIQQTNGTLVIDDSKALDNQMTGRVAVGRQVVAHGYWDNGTFYATMLTTGPVPPGP